MALCRCFDGHNKNPTKCLYHGSPTIGLTSSVHPHIYVLSQIWLNIFECDVKQKHHFNSTLYVFLPHCHSRHSYMDNRFIIWIHYFVYLSVWQFLPFIFNYPCLHGSLPSFKPPLSWLCIQQYTCTCRNNKNSVPLSFKLFLFSSYMLQIYS